jgi:hypothetical protein
MTACNAVAARDTLVKLSKVYTVPRKRLSSALDNQSNARSVGNMIHSPRRLFAVVSTIIGEGFRPSSKRPESRHDGAAPACNQPISNPCLEKLLTLVPL